MGPKKKHKNSQTGDRELLKTLPAPIAMGWMIAITHSKQQPSSLEGKKKPP